MLTENDVSVLFLELTMRDSVAGTSMFVAPLTGLRFVAAMIVLIGHGSMVLPGDEIAFGIQQITSIGMTLFFVLSGFVLWLTYADLFQNRWSRAALH
jgi:peptidoglycan/LPS O-acetylase OafA/YrhL